MKKQTKPQKVNRIRIAGLIVESSEGDINKLSKVADRLLTKHKNLIINAQPIEVYNS